MDRRRRKIKQAQVKEIALFERVAGKGATKLSEEALSAVVHEFGFVVDKEYLDRLFEAYGYVDDCGENQIDVEKFGKEIFAFLSDATIATTNKEHRAATRIQAVHRGRMVRADAAEAALEADSFSRTLEHATVFADYDAEGNGQLSQSS